MTKCAVIVITWRHYGMSLRRCQCFALIWWPLGTTGIMLASYQRLSDISASHAMRLHYRTGVLVAM